MFCKVLFLPFKLVAKFLSFIFQGILSFILFAIVMLLLFVGTLVGTFNFWFPSVSNWYLSSKTGFELQIDKSECSLFKGIIDFKGIHLLNPQNAFEQTKFVNIDYAYVDVDMMSLLKPEIIFNKIALKVDDVTVIKNNADQINALELKNTLQKLFAPKNQQSQLLKYLRMLQKKY